MYHYLIESQALVDACSEPDVSGCKICLPVVILDAVYGLSRAFTLNCDKVTPRQSASHFNCFGSNRCRKGPRLRTGVLLVSCGAELNFLVIYAT